MDVDSELLPQLATAYLLDMLKIECDHWGTELTGLTAFLFRQLAAFAGL
jgi:hypothetical protein